MNNSSTDIDVSLKEEHERASKAWGAYTAFVAVLLVTTVSKSNEYSSAPLVISLLALSLPSLSALIILDFVVRVRQKRKGSMYRGVATALGFLPSVSGIMILIGHFSVIAAVLFGLLVAFWVRMILTVAIVGGNPHSII